MVCRLDLAHDPRDVRTYVLDRPGSPRRCSRAPEPVAGRRATASPSLCGARFSEVRTGGETLARSLPERRDAELPGCGQGHSKLRDEPVGTGLGSALAWQRLSRSSPCSSRLVWAFLVLVGGVRLRERLFPRSPFSRRLPKPEPTPDPFPRPLPVGYSGSVLRLTRRATPGRRRGIKPGRGRRAPQGRGRADAKSPSGPAGLTFSAGSDNVGGCGL